MRWPTKNEKIPKRMELEAIMIDDRIIKAHEFLHDDDFINTKEFKSFLFKIKQNELSLQLNPGDLDEKVTILVKNYSNMMQIVKPLLWKKLET